MTDTNKFIGMLMNSRTQTHYFHLHTNSYAQHKALQAYYTKIVPLIDAYSETYMGKYSKIKPPKLNKRFLSTPELTNTYFKTLLTRMKAMKLHKDKHLQNIHDEIVALIRQTIYMLKLK